MFVFNAGINLILLFTDSLDVYNVLSTSSKSLISKLKMVVSDDNVKAVFKYYIHDFVLYFCKSSEESDNAKVKYNFVFSDYI